MRKIHLLAAASLLLAASPLVLNLRAEDTPGASPTVGGIAPRNLLDLSAAGSESRLTPDEPASHGQVTITHNASPAGALVTIAPGEAGYPGVSLKPENGTPWDLSPFGHVSVTATNTGTKKLGLGLRVDGADWKDTNSNIAYLKPGETGTVTVIFGYSYGHPATAIKSSSVSQILLFGGKATTEPESFRIESIEAGGVAGEKMPVDPSSVRITPKDGLLLGAGASPLDAAKNVVNKGAQASLGNASGSQDLTIVFTGGDGKASAGIKPEAGRWSLSDSLEVRAKVKNSGQNPITPTLHVDSQGGSIEATTDAPLAPGAEAELVVSYINPKPWKNIPSTIKSEPGTGNNFTNNQVSAVRFSAAPDTAERNLTVESIRADVPPYSAPDWFGKRPPIEGEWIQTFSDDFDGTSLDMTKWNDTAENYWDKRSHFTKDNLILGGGVMKEVYEKKTGFPNGDATKKPTDYAVGYIDTYGKWVQRYGYFETRVKLPTAPGLWPAFWLMPDRGAAAGRQWKRSDTANNGMEFDILEFLSGWGPNRYNIAMHWDGYGKNHKSTGSTATYVQPDKDGYITTGLLWTPGSAIYYCNGKEVLRFENERVSSVPSFIIVDMVSGGWDNLPLDDAKLPDNFIIDYVRVWQRKDLASEVDGLVKPPAAVTPPPAK